MIVFCMNYSKLPVWWKREKSDYNFIEFMFYVALAFAIGMGFVAAMIVLIFNTLKQIYKHSLESVSDKMRFFGTFLYLLGFFAIPIIIVLQMIMQEEIVLDSLEILAICSLWSDLMHFVKKLYPTQINPSLTPYVNLKKWQFYPFLLWIAIWGMLRYPHRAINIYSNFCIHVLNLNL